MDEILLKNLILLRFFEDSLISVVLRWAGD